MHGDTVVRPTGSRAALIALGVGAPVAFLALLLSLAVTNGSWWSLAGAACGFLVAWLRARQVSVIVEAEGLTVHNFYGSAYVRRDGAETATPFSYWVNPNFTCLAVRDGSTRKPMHATALPSSQARYEEEARGLAARLGLSLRER